VKKIFKTVKKILLYSTLFVSIISISLLACKKSGSGIDGANKAKLQVYLTDDPGDYEKVFIDVRDVQINVSGDSVNGWQSLQGVNAGVYDLLTLVNDQDTLLADAEIPSGRLHQLRLILGPDNFVKLQGDPTMIKLETPSAQQSGLKLNIQADVVNGILYVITLDFDVAKSIVKTGNKKYILKPVIRTVLAAVGGSIKGFVRPDTFQTAVSAILGVDTITTFTGANGGYMIKGLPAGSYKLYFMPSDSTFRDSSRLNIPVVVNTVTTVDTMFLQQ
jgi:Domain of unknown function (DUF4382)